MSPRLFGTDGVRGIANQDLTPQLAMRLAYSSARILFADDQIKGKVIIGHDTRISCQMLEAALVAGFTAAGSDVLLAGVIPTPGIAYLGPKHACDLGVVISASHNSYAYNGIKIFDSHGFKLPDQVEDKIEAGLNLLDEDDNKPTGDKLGQIMPLAEAAAEYRQHLEKIVKLDLTGLRLALDLANGASTTVAPELFRNLGAEVELVGHAPDGININEDCGSTHVEHLQSYVKEHGLDMGFAFDGDADRLMVVDEQGDILDGDVILSILAKNLHDEGRLAEDTLVVTVMSNYGLDLMAQREGIKLEKTKVGDRYVLERMRQGGYILGGEQSGHLLFLDDTTTGDGILSALKLLEVVTSTKKPLSELKQVVQIFPQVIVNVRVENFLKAQVMADDELKEAKHKVMQTLQGRGRVLIRPSGTEPCIRVMLEGEDREEIQGLAEELAGFISDKYSS